MVKVLKYTDAEYKQWLQHATWTRAETDTLFDLCRRFDLRWPVIYDRMPGLRSVEAIKERYYETCRLLLQGRIAAANSSVAPGSGSATEWAEHPLARYTFDEKHERERKVEFERLYARTAEEVEEEMRRLEQVGCSARQLMRSRKDEIHQLGHIVRLRVALSLSQVCV